MATLGGKYVKDDEDAIGILGTFFNQDRAKMNALNTIPDGLAKRKLQRIIQENESKKLLSSYGLKPIRVVGFFGPNGSGRTYAAEAVASALDLPFRDLTKECNFSAGDIKPGVTLTNHSSDAEIVAKNLPNEIVVIRRPIEAAVTCIMEDTLEFNKVTAQRQKMILAAALGAYAAEDFSVSTLDGDDDRYPAEVVDMAEKAIKAMLLADKHTISTADFVAANEY